MKLLKWWVKLQARYNAHIDHTVRKSMISLLTKSTIKMSFITEC